MTGAAPVPVPPPMPAVTNTMSAPSSTSSSRSVSSSAAARPTSGSAPAPSPFVSFSPSCTLIGRDALLERLHVGVGDDELHAGEAGPHHAVDGIAAAAADADDLDAGAQPPRVVAELDSQRIGVGIVACTSPAASSPFQASRFRSIGVRIACRSRRPLPPRPPQLSVFAPASAPRRWRRPAVRRTRAGSARSAPPLARRGSPPSTGVSCVHSACARCARPTAVANAGLATWSASPPPTPRRAPAPDRQVEDLLGDLGQAVEDGAAAGEHDARVERLLVAGVPDLVPHQVEDLLGPRLQHLGEDASAHDARPPAADAGHLDRLLVVHHARERAAAASLQPLGLRDRHPQARPRCRW